MFQKTFSPLNSITTNFFVQTKCNNELLLQQMMQQWLDSYLYFLKPLLEDFKFVKILKIIQLMMV